MSAYRVHHGYPADGFSGETTPSRSLLTWLQSVSTTDVLGATAEPVVVHAAKPIRDDDDGGEEGGDLDGDAAATQPFSSSRTAQITILEAPCRSAEVTLRELREALRAARFQMIQGLSGRPLQALDLGREVVSLSHDRPNREESISFRKIALSYISSPIPGIFTPEEYSMGQGRVTARSPSSTDVESPLWELVNRLRYTVLDKYFMPNAESQPAPERDPKSDIDVSLGSFKSAEVQVGSTDGTLEVTSSMPHLMDESSQSTLMLSERELNPSKLIGQELLAIKHLNISEEAINYQIAAQMPMEKYLVTYVLPSLTPALTEVVKLRPDDPITVLADILYDYKRRTDV
ncbi:unnamed protein product [Phytomonas sp. EM1]|nr:unnamed protein product [Phytomonas sp. EM1]|eukprot:CCW63649.1 unnamed protein product [Phytomonas sp. isolate EM1]